MNFTVDLYESDDTVAEKWGRIWENGSATGLLNEMVCNGWYGQRVSK